MMTKEERELISRALDTEMAMGSHTGGCGDCVRLILHATAADSRIAEVERERDTLRSVIHQAYNADCEREDDGGIVEGEAASILGGHLGR
jgi:hypothetical protein